MVMFPLTSVATCRAVVLTTGATPLMETVDSILELILTICSGIEAPDFSSVMLMTDTNSGTSRCDEGACMVTSFAGCQILVSPGCSKTLI